MAGSLQSFFIRNLTSAFHDLQIGDRTIIEYLSEMLTRFARLENLYRVPTVPFRKLTTVGEMLIELDRRMDVSRDEFNPFSEKEISRHIGDFTLFMTGLFKEYCEYHSIQKFYLEEGPRSYQKVAEWTRLNYEPGEGLYGELSENYEKYSGALDYMKKVQFPLRGPDCFGNFARLLNQ
jgi:hypothetical protein